MEIAASLFLTRHVREVRIAAVVYACQMEPATETDALVGAATALPCKFILAGGVFFGLGLGE